MKAPPLLFSYSSLEHYLDALSHDLREKHGQRIDFLLNQGLPPVVSLRCLATLIGYSSKFLGAIVKNHEHYYRTFTIPKGNKRRTIQAPKVALKVFQKWFGHHLAEHSVFHDSVYGFVRGRSAVHAAQVHCGARWIFSVDIKDFFPSTPIDKIHNSLVEIGYPGTGADLVAKLCCYKGNLAQGSPASPILSNLIFRHADEQLSEIAVNNGLRHTRYADDIVFSGTELLPEIVKEEIRQVVINRGWQLSDKKEYFAQHPNRLKVHGLLVHGERARLTKGYRNRIRAYKHLLSAGKITDDDFFRVKGHLNYAKSVEEI